MSPNTKEKALPLRKIHTAPSIEDSDSGYSSPADNESRDILNQKNSRSCSGPLSDCVEDPVVTEARRISRDILDSEWGEDNGRATWHFGRQYQSPRSATILRLAQQLLDKHEILYKSMVGKLQLASSNADAKLLDLMCDEVFGDGQVSWGRIVALYALCLAIARSSNNNGDRRMAQRSVTHIGQYIGEKLVNWIKNEGGWAAIENACPPEDHMERTIWKGLLWTGISLGILASVINCVR